jgi:hypothetical protein
MAAGDGRREHAVKRALIALVLCACAPPVRYADREILWRWPDDRPIPMPRKRELYIPWQHWRDAFFDPADRVLGLDYLHEARNVNALDEVPDSAWFADPRRVAGQAHPRALSADELRWGALTPEDVPELPFTIVRSKDVGDSPGFQALDARGKKYLVKLDPPGHLGLITSTEMVVTRLAWASGWRVPALALIDALPSQLRVDPSATVKGRYGERVPFTDEMLRQMLARSPRTAEGNYRLLASRWLPGVAIGEFAYAGRVKDDPNDRVPHEDRRDLRGFGVFAAWVNDLDTGQNNTLDMYQGEPGRGHVVHYQQDLGGSFDDWGGAPAPLWMGAETWIEPHLILRSFVTLGLWPRQFDDGKLRGEHERLAQAWPELGAFEAEHFDPLRWRPERENPAFARMTARDRYWGAKRVIAFSRDELRVVIATGRYRPEAAERLLAILWKRREAIARAFLSELSPLDHFHLEPAGLCFHDLWSEAGMGEAAVHAAAPVIGQCVPLPAPGYRIITLATRRPGSKRADRPVRVHLIVAGAASRILGIER